MQLPKNYDKKISHASLGFGCPSTYNKTSQNYGETYLAEKVSANVPTYSEVVDAIPEFKRMCKLLKNTKVAGEQPKVPILDCLDELALEKQKFDTNVIVPRKFPVQAEQYKYPAPIQNAGSILYKTTNRDYGNKLPANLDVPTKFHPKVDQYTRSFPNNYRFNSLNTATTFSKVHKALDEY